MEWALVNKGWMGHPHEGDAFWVAQILPFSLKFQNTLRPMLLLGGVLGSKLFSENYREISEI